MKKARSILLGLLAVAIVAAGSGIFTSCGSKSGEVMYQNKPSKNRIIKSNYKVKGNNRSNSNTYHAY